jgi:site-specific DNA recombinase
MTKPARCAVYTRKSTEEGLDQAFNSLDAQREACAAYVVSQRHEGWTEVRESYDDGGFSGGNMNRPGLRQLLDDVRARKVDVIVVYKVDRLTRSLADFAKIIELLDGAGASFVSVTQAFNTTTSMGRLTLNVLLSFAQFEREVTGERIRDKIAASKKKGMWMGGNVPLGYDVKYRQLVINPTEAAIVRSIYGRYLQVNSIIALVEELRQKGTTTKHVGGRGGIWFGRGSLNHLLRNRLYIGEIHFQGANYAGQHDAIVDRELWEQVQAKLNAAAAAQRSGARALEPSLLSGLLWDPAGRKMSPTHGCKNKQRYRYYVTVTAHYEKTQSPFRFSAHAIELIVVDRLASWLDDASAQACPGSAASEVQEELAAAGSDALALRAGTNSEKRSVLLRRISRIDLSDSTVAIELIGVEARLTAQLGQVRRGNDVRIVIRASSPMPAKPQNEELVHMLADARAAQHLALSKPDHSLADLARSAGRSERVFKRMLRLSYLSPSIVQAILEGDEPPSLTCRGLHRISSIPIAWEEQRRFFQFD